jgi:phosphatidylethanolamine-binding protein (PEBP) family uncharacterized protein
MRSERLNHRFMPWFLACGVLSALMSCAAEEQPNDPAGAGMGGSTAATGGTGGTAGVATGGGAGTVAAGTGGSATGGTAGAATGGTAGTVAAGSGGTAGTAIGGAGAGGASGGMPAGGTSGTGGSTAGSSAAGVGGTAGSGAGGAGAGGASGAAGSGSGSSGTGNGGTGSGAFTLTSPDHMEGAMFADPYTCAEAGFNGSILPELNWTAGPAGTMSYAITFIDVTLAHAPMPNDNGYHWVIWNIPAATRTLAEGFKDQASIGAQENRDFLGPCPNFGGGGANTDTYEFTIYALSQASITISGSGTAAVKDAEMKLDAMNLAKTKLTGTSNASPP